MMESYDRTMELYEVGTLASATENSLEAIYEFCLLIAATSGSVSQHRIDRLRAILESIKIGIYHLNNWEIPAEKLPPYTLVMIGEDIGPGDHIRLYNEFIKHMESMGDKELETQLVHCASLITERLYRLFAILMSELTCDPDDMDEIEYERINWFFKQWWDLEDEPFQIFNENVYGDGGLWEQTWSLGSDLENKISEVEENGIT